LKRKNLESVISKEEGVVAFFTALALNATKSPKEDHDTDEYEDDDTTKEFYIFLLESGRLA